MSVISGFLTAISVSATTSPLTFEAATGEQPAILAPAYQNVLTFLGTKGKSSGRRLGSKLYELLLTSCAGSIQVPDMKIWNYEHLPPSQKAWGSSLQTDKVDLDVGQDPFALQLQHFAKVSTGQVAPLTGAGEATQSLFVLEALLQSIKSRQTVRVMKA
jgi:predicted dehydrogenase